MAGPLGPGALAAAALTALTAVASTPRSGGIDLEPPPGIGLRAADCGACHPDEVAEWSTSRHAVAATNPMFLASWRRWPNGWCLGCHVPDREGQAAWIGAPAVPGVLRAPVEAPADGAWRDGVGCAACHVDGGEILAARPPLPDAVEAHPIRVIPSLTGAETCGRCHAFPFQRHTPGPFAYGETPAQDTVAEWSRSSAAGTPCAGCHMPDGAHSFPGAHDPALVRGALDLRVVRRGARVVAVVSSDPPHRIPTGDPFRGIELRVCGDAGCSGPTASSQLRRRFAPDATSWALIDDTTLSPWRPRRRLVAPWIEGASRWELWYRFGERRLEPELPAAEVGYVITAGDLAP